MDGIIESAKEKGYVETMFARRRYVPDINAKNKQLQAFASRVCRNTPIQGTDVYKRQAFFFISVSPAAENDNKPAAG